MLVNQVVQAFHLDPVKLVWLEQYVSSYSQVTFEWKDRRATNPQWNAIAESRSVMMQRLSAAGDGHR